MRRRTASFAAALALMAALQPGGLALACGPWPTDARFWYPSRPGPEPRDFIAGDLGILDRGLAPVYWVVAYRHLSGIGMDGPSRDAVADYWEPAPEDPDVERRGTRVRPAGWDAWFATVKRLERRRGETVSHLYFTNCNTDAFANAARTLRERIDRWGPDSEWVAAWREAQSQVFANCGGAATAIPVPLPDAAPALARADRQYQVAAAHFYATDFDEAEARFRAVAESTESPWSRLARYLVARVHVRRALLLEDGSAESLARAESELRALIDDPEIAPLHPAGRGLLSFVRVRSAPLEYGGELARRLRAPSLGSPLRQALIDYLHLLPALAHAEADPMSVWIQAARSAPALAADAAVSGWRDTGELPWLVLALMTASPERAEVGPLLEAAAAVAPDSPAQPTLRYHRARLLAATEGPEVARELIDATLREHPDLSPADRNRFYALREPLAEDLGAFLRFAQRVPVEVGYSDGGSGRLIGNPQDSLQELRDGRALLDHPTAHVLNRDFTPRHLLAVTRAPELPEFLRRQVSLAAWMRAVLEGDRASADELARSLGRLAPELSPELALHAAAPSPEEWEFVTALTALRFPGLSPLVAPTVGRTTPLGELDSVRQNWWCGYSMGRGGASVPRPLFVGAEQVREAEAMRARLKSQGAGPIALGERILRWTEVRPTDDRLAEALHRVVRATRFGCQYDENGRTDYGDVSRAAFRHLHRHFPRSEWAAKTPYWFR